MSGHHSVHSAERVVKEIKLCPLIDGPGQVDPGLLASAEGHTPLPNKGVVSILKLLYVLYEMRKCVEGCVEGCVEECVNGGVCGGVRCVEEGVCGVRGVVCLRRGTWRVCVEEVAWENDREVCGGIRNWQE